MKKILLVEDSREHVLFFTEKLREAGYDVEVVETVPRDTKDEKFQQLVSRANEFLAIVWDGDIFAGVEPLYTFQGHIQEFANEFSGPMIANSSVGGIRERQITAGCTHQVTRKDPDTLLALLKQILPGT